MTGGIGGATASTYGMLTRLIADNTQVRHRLDTLTSQASNGLIADTYAGLGAGAATSLRLQPQLTSLRAWQGNIDAATGRMAIAQSAMTQVQKIASDLLSQTMTLNGLNASQVDSVAANARAALTQLAGLLNTRDGDVYVFAGQDTANPPVPAPDAITSSGFYTQIAASVAGLAVNGAAATAAATLAVAGSNAAGTSPFSAYLSRPASALAAPVAQVDADRTVPVGLLASANGAVASTGASTTGSYMRDLMRALATIGSLNGGQADDPGFAALVQDTRDSLTGAIGAMGADAGVLGDAQTGLAATRAGLDHAATALSGQVSAAEEVDMAATLSNLSLVQAQLQASYQLIVGANGLSLTKFLPAA